MLVLGPHGRRRLVALVLVAAALGALYMFWLRDSSLVRVESVSVSGVSSSPDGVRVRSKLTAAAKHMTTLRVDPDALRNAVADEPTVHSLSVQADFPHGLRIEIVENRPVALLVSPARSVAVAPDGTVLAGSKMPSGLPTVRVASLPPGVRVTERVTRDRVAVAGAAPPRLLARVATISVQHGRGAVAQLEHGPVIIFGGAVDLARKWAAVAAVLAQHTSAGATYIDVRMAERPVAGGLPLEQDPQPQAQVGGMLPAYVPPPGSTTAASPSPTQQQTQSQTPVTPSTTAPPPQTTTGAPAPSQSQP
jgi:cell division protein FtsQ